MNEDIDKTTTTDESNDENKNIDTVSNEEVIIKKNIKKRTYKKKIDKNDEFISKVKIIISLLKYHSFFEKSDIKVGFIKKFPDEDVIQLNKNINISLKKLVKEGFLIKTKKGYQKFE